MLTVVLLVVIVAVRENRIAIGVVKEASKACSECRCLGLPAHHQRRRHMPDDMVAHRRCVPRERGSITAGHLVDLTSNNSSAAATRRSSASAAAHCESKDVTNYLFLYHFFGLLWTNQAIQAWNIIVISGAIAGTSPRPRGA